MNIDEIKARLDRAKQRGRGISLSHKEGEEVIALIEAVEARDKVNSALREFARQVIKEQCWGYEMDGLDIQDLAEKLELIAKHTATEDDVEDGDDYEAGDVIYKFTDLLGSE